MPTAIDPSIAIERFDPRDISTRVSSCHDSRILTAGPQNHHCARGLSSVKSRMSYFILRLEFSFPAACSRLREQAPTKTCVLPFQSWTDPFMAMLHVAMAALPEI